MTNINNIINGRFIESDKLPSNAYRAYRSLIRKSENIKNHLDIINQIQENIISYLPEDNIKEKDKLVCSIHDYCENIYTCCEYILQVLRATYMRIYPHGTLKDGFNKTLNDIENNPDRPVYNNNKILTNYFLKSKNWFTLIHSIRTEETHNGMGEIEVDIDNLKLFYINTLRRPENGIRNIKIDVEQLNMVYYEVCSYINELDVILNNIKFE